MYIRNLPNLLMLAIAALFFTACNNASDEKDQGETANDTTSVKLKEEQVSFTADTITSNSYLVYNESAGEQLPVVLVIPEWWGLNDYAKSRARQLAELGYMAMAVDVYGGGKTADNPTDAGNYATPFYENPALGKGRLEAAINKVRENSKADTGRLAAIGYCFGGFVVLNTAKQGSPLDGVVSFHGNLGGVTPSKDLLKSRILVCHGGSDPFVPEAEVNQFKKQMDSIGADYQFKVYPDATHAFTNPNATEAGKKFNLPLSYNGAADTASWNDMKAFLTSVLGK